MTKTEVFEWIGKRRLVPVVRASSAQEAIMAVDALMEGGIDVLEITMTVPGAVDVVREVTLRFGDSALVGAGTVLDPKTAEECVEAGARFIVSPALNPETVRACVSMDVLCAPGALTPTEVLSAWNVGADVVKIFPCEAMGGPSYVKALKAPLPHVPLMPTGGVTLENLSEFFKAGAIAVGVGGNLVDLKLLREGRRDEFVLKARRFAEVAMRSVN